MPISTDAEASSTPLIPIGAAVCLGFVMAWGLVWLVSDACFEATSKGPAGAAWLLGFQVAAAFCVGVTKAPPWFLLSGIVAAPSVLLTWYWRDQKRRDDHANKQVDIAHKVEDIRIAQESGISERYTKAAELLASENEISRVNGMNALWDLARESASHRSTVSRTLAAFVRWRAKPPSEADVAIDRHAGSSPASDVHVAMALLAEPAWTSEKWKENGKRIAVDLSKTWLKGLKLPRAQLQNVVLTHANLEGVNLAEADLSGADLTSANLNEAFLQQATLRNANLTLAKLERAILCGVEADGACFSMSACKEADFSMANLSAARLDRAGLEDACLVRAVLHGASLLGSRANGANMLAADFKDADLSGIRFVEANLHGADLRRAKIEYATFQGADLQDALFDVGTPRTDDGPEAPHEPTTGADE